MGIGLCAVSGARAGVTSSEMRASRFPGRGDQVLRREPLRDRGQSATLALALGGRVIPTVLADDRPRPLHERQDLEQVGATGSAGSWSSSRSYASADRVRVDGVCIGYPPGVGARALLAKDLAWAWIWRPPQSLGAAVCLGGAYTAIRYGPRWWFTSDLRPVKRGWCRC
jgi:hypothetical protein